MLEGVADIRWVDGLQVGTFSIRDVVARANEFRRSPLSYLYLRVDYANPETPFGAYYTEEGFLTTARPRGD